MTPDAEQPKPATTPPALAPSPTNPIPNPPVVPPQSASTTATAAPPPQPPTSSSSNNAHPLANMPTHHPPHQSASKLAQVLSETLQEQDTLRNQLHQYQRRVAKLEHMLEASGGPTSERTVPLRALLDAEAKLEASEKARMELESRWKAVRDQWAEAHRYWNLLEARAQDTRAGIDRLFEGELGHLPPQQPLSSQVPASSSSSSQQPSSLPGALAALPFSGVRAESSRKRHHFPTLPPPPNPAQRRPRDSSVGHGQPPSKRLKSSDGRHSREDRARFPDSAMPSFPPPNQFPAPPQYPAHISRRPSSQYPPDALLERRPTSGASSDFPPNPRSRSHSPASSTLSLDEELLDLATDSPRRRQQQPGFPPNGAAGAFPPGTAGPGGGNSRKRPRGAVDEVYNDADAEGERDEDIDAVMDDLEGRGRPEHGRPPSDMDRRQPPDMDRRPSEVDRRASYPYPPNSAPSYRGHDFQGGAPYGPPALHYGPSDRGARGFERGGGSFSEGRGFNGDRGSFSERGAFPNERNGSFAEPSRGGSFSDRGASFNERFPHGPPYAAGGGPPPPGSGPYGGPGPTFSVAPPPNSASSGPLFPAQQGSFSAGQQPPFPASSAQQATFLPPTSGPPQSRKQQVRGDASMGGVGSGGDRARGENKDGAGSALGASALPAGVLPAGMTQGTGRASHAILNSAGQRTCRQCGQPGRYKDGKCVEKWGPGPEGPGTVCDRCRKKMKRVERRGTGTDNIISVVMPSSSFAHSQTQPTQITPGMLGPNGEVDMGDGADMDLAGRRSPADVRSPGEMRSPGDVRSPSGGMMGGPRSPNDSRSPDDAGPRSSPTVGRDPSLSPLRRPSTSLPSSRHSDSTSPPTTALPEHETQPTQRNEAQLERHETQATQIGSQSPQRPPVYPVTVSRGRQPTAGDEDAHSPSRSPSPRRFQPALQPHSRPSSSMRTTSNSTTPPEIPSSSSTPKPPSAGSDRGPTPVPVRRPGSGGSNGDQRPPSSNSVQRPGSGASGASPLVRHSSQQPPSTKVTPPNGVNGTPPTNGAARTIPSAMQVGHGATEANGTGGKMEAHSHPRWMKTEEVG